MELLGEILLELYLGIAEMIVPDHKFKKWQEKLLQFLSVFAGILILVLIVAGVVLMIETEQTALGIALLSIGCAMLVVQVVLFIILLVREIKAEKQKKQINNMLFSDDDDN